MIPKFVRAFGNKKMAALFTLLFSTAGLHASEADIKIPPLNNITFDGLNGISGTWLMYFGLATCIIGAIFGLVQYVQTVALPVHECMARVSKMIWETCKTYMLHQGKFLIVLWGLVAACIFFY